MTTLVSFLGKGQVKDTGYRNTNYRFDNSFVQSVPFLGLALTEYLKPQRLILVGTAGSMWDIFFEQQGEATDEEVLTLIDAVHESRVELAMLKTQEEKLSQKLGLPVICHLIPYARNTAEQTEILLTLAELVYKEEEIVLDVTHGFRHLPMLALVAARYLTHIANVKIGGLYYGALEMTSTNGETPVLRLDGMLHMLDWIESLATYGKDGDYGVFTSLLQQDGLPADKAKQLSQAAFFERCNNPVKARETLSSVFSAIETHDGQMAKLFHNELKNRINWFRGPDRAAWEQSLADAYLERRDYVRAVIYLYESLVTRATLKQKLNPNNFSDRDEAWKKLRQDNQDARDLEYLRNALAHGIRSDRNEIRNLISNEDRLKTRLKEFRRKLFQ